jgi:hypothetical protein
MVRRFDSETAHRRGMDNYIDIKIKWIDVFQSGAAGTILRSERADNMLMLFALPALKHAID